MIAEKPSFADLLNRQQQPFFLARVFYGSMNVFKSGYIHEKSQKIRVKQSNRPEITKWLWKGIERFFGHVKVA